MSLRGGRLCGDDLRPSVFFGEKRIGDKATSGLRFCRDKLLSGAGVSPEEIELVIVVTASADHAFPSTACLVQDRIGAKNAAAFDLSAGCSGFVYSLGVASQMVKSGLYKKALIIGAETLSRIMNWDPFS